MGKLDIFIGTFCILYKSLSSCYTDVPRGSNFRYIQIFYFHIHFPSISIKLWWKFSSFRLKMKSTLILVVLGTIVLFGGTVNAWGGIFNRFSPEMLNNLGYGGNGESYRSQPYSQVNICLYKNFFLFSYFFFVVCFNVLINIIGVLKRIRMFGDILLFKWANGCWPLKSFVIYCWRRLSSYIIENQTLKVLLT